MSDLDIEKALIKAVQSVQQYADDHVNTLDSEGFLCEDEQGREGYCHANEKEMWFVTDAINGLIADEDFLRLVRDEVVAREKARAADGCCITCGCKLPDHWGTGCNTQTVGGSQT
jgi:hypothetical protein